MSWNYRVVRRMSLGLATTEPEPWYGIHEAYYDNEGRCTSITVDAVAIESESVNGLREVRAMMFGAFKQPVLDYETREEIDVL